MAFNNRQERLDHIDRFEALQARHMVDLQMRQVDNLRQRIDNVRVAQEQREQEFAAVSNRPNWLRFNNDVPLELDAVTQPPTQRGSTAPRMSTIPPYTGRPLVPPQSEDRYNIPFSHTIPESSSGATGFVLLPRLSNARQLLDGSTVLLLRPREKIGDALARHGPDFADNPWLLAQLTARMSPKERERHGYVLDEFNIHHSTRDNVWPDEDELVRTRT